MVTPIDAGEKVEGRAWPYTTADLLGGGFEEEEEGDETDFTGSAGLAGGGGGSLLAAGAVSSLICALSAKAKSLSSLSFEAQGRRGKVCE